MRAIATSRQRVGVFAVSALVAVVGGLSIAEAATVTPSQAPSHQHAEHGEHGDHGEHEH